MLEQTVLMKHTIQVYLKILWAFYIISFFCAIYHTKTHSSNTYTFSVFRVQALSLCHTSVSLQWQRVSIVQRLVRWAHQLQVKGSNLAYPALFFLNSSTGAKPGSFYKCSIKYNIHYHTWKEALQVFYKIQYPLPYVEGSFYKCSIKYNIHYHTWEEALCHPEGATDTCCLQRGNHWGHLKRGKQGTRRIQFMCWFTNTVWKDVYVLALQTVPCPIVRISLNQSTVWKTEEEKKKGGGVGGSEGGGGRFTCFSVWSQ